MTPFEKGRNLLKQWLKFNAVGAMGIVVQLVVLSILTHLARMNYLLATFFGVEAAVLHNFVWHERWTWAHRVYGGTREMLQRLLKFNFTTGLFSIVANLFFFMPRRQVDITLEVADHLNREVVDGNRTLPAQGIDGDGQPLRTRANGDCVLTVAQELHDPQNAGEPFLVPPRLTDLFAPH